MFDFGALPPEINSARMYAGPGSGPMMAAAAAWNSLAAELGSAAAAYQTVIAELTGEAWRGPSSAAMAAAAQPYVAWMSTTAAAAERAASQATASAAAYHTAFAMTVPPPVIAANRAQLAALVATNILGQNTPAIMATEAHYMEMWAQDAAAMYGYAASSASAGTLNPLTSPAPTANPAGLFGQAAALSQAAGTATGTHAGLPQLVSTLPSAVQSFASPLAAPAAPGPLGSINDFLGIPFISNSINSTNNVVAWNVMNIIPNMILLQNALGNANAPAAAAGAMSAEAPLASGLGSTVLAGTPAPAGVAGFGGAPVMAGMGQASAVGKLSVPTSWSAATPQLSSASALEGTGWAVAAEETPPVATMPAGMPSVASASRAAAGFGAPRYGFKPTVMPKTVLV
jgi:PPE-repeat protein